MADKAAACSLNLREEVRRQDVGSSVTARRLLPRFGRDGNVEQLVRQLLVRVIIHRVAGYPQDHDCALFGEGHQDPPLRANVLAADSWPGLRSAQGLSRRPASFGGQQDQVSLHSGFDIRRHLLEILKCLRNEAELIAPGGPCAPPRVPSVEQLREVVRRHGRDRPVVQLCYSIVQALPGPQVLDFHQGARQQTATIGL